MIKWHEPNRKCYLPEERLLFSVKEKINISVKPLEGEYAADHEGDRVAGVDGSFIITDCESLYNL